MTARNHHETRNPLKQYRNGTREDAPMPAPARPFARNPERKQVRSKTYDAYLPRSTEDVEPEMEQPLVTITFVHPDALKPSPQQPPARTENVAELKESIARFGIQVPLIVTHDGHIIEGHRRWRCAQMLKLPMVPILRQPQGIVAAELYETLNSTARKLTPGEELHVHLRGGVVSKRTRAAIDYLALAVGPEGLKEIAAGGFSPTGLRGVAVMVCRYCDRETPDFPGKVVRWLLRHRGQFAVRRAMADLVEPETLIRAIEADAPLTLERRYTTP